MICPKCGRPVDPSAVICSGCDFILDTGFLGDEILDEERSLRPGMGGVDPAVFNLADAVILGDIDEAAQSFETSDSGFHVKESTNARLYVSGRSQAMMAPDAVPAVVDPDLAGVRLTPFEKHVLSFIDGKRPVEIIRLRAGLDESEVKTALATLADKGVVEVVGRALVETDPFQETAQRRVQKPRRTFGLAGAVAAALGPVADETDRAIEEAFRTATGLSPLEASELAPPQDDGNVFSSLSGDPLADIVREPGFGRGPLTSKSELSGIGDESSLPSDTAFTQRPSDDDLPSDADSFDLLAHTSEIERSPALEERLRRASSAKRGGLGPMATNARRVLSDPELAELLGDDDEQQPDALEPSMGTRATAPPRDLESGGASDGFDDFGEASELQTALLPGFDSLSQGPPSSAVFKSTTGTASLPALARGRTGFEPQLVDESESLSALLDDDLPLEAPSEASAMPPPERAGMREELGDGGDLADLVGDAPPSLEGTDTSKAGSPPEGERDLHSAITAAPALQVSVSGSEESHDPFADLDLEESFEESMEASLEDPLKAESEGSREAPPAIAVPSEDRAPSDEGTAVYAQNPFASDLDDEGGDEKGEGAQGVAAGADDSAFAAALASQPAPYAEGSGDDDDEPVTSTRPVSYGLESPRPSSEVSAIFEVADESEAGPSEGEAADFYEAATDGVPAFLAAAALARGSLADAFSEEEVRGAADLDEDVDEDPPTARGFENPGNRLPRPSTDLAGASTKGPAPEEAPSSSYEELIDDALIIRPAAPTMQLRGASVLEAGLSERGSPRPVSAELSSVHDEVEVSEPAVSVPMPAAPSSQETAHLERPSELEALAPIAAPRASPLPPPPPSHGEETALFSDVGDVGAAPSEASELSLGDAWASSEDEGEPDEGYDVSADEAYADDAYDDDAYDDEASYADGSHAEEDDEHSSDSTQVLSGPRLAAPAAPRREASDGSEETAAEVERASPPPYAASRNDPEAMREKARKLFEDALKDFREGRIGAARMNAKLATIYDPANEEYRAALEQWGKGGRRRAQQVASYAALYDEAQEREGAGDIEGAIGLLEQGAEQFPEIAAIQNRLGVLLAIHKREYDRASAYIQRAIELDPENLHYKSNLGKILSRRRQRQQRAKGG